MTHDRLHPEPIRPHRVIAERVREVRRTRGLTAAQLGEKMAEAGVGWDRNTVASLENGRRSAVSVEELLCLAYVLDVAPVHLGVPLDADGWYAVTPDVATTYEHARAWIRGTDALPGTDERKYFSEVPQDEWRRFNERQADTERHLEEAGIVSKTRAQQPVVAVITTSRKGVLVTRRHDGKPPWGFVSGEVEPGERPEDAAVRETKEETSLEIRAGKLIGERDHPATGRHMIYMAATPVRGSTRIITGDEAELAEVRWASLAEALELMPDMFGPVRDYLAGAL